MSSAPLLVAYAGKHGSTREVAEFIANVLAEHGHRVEMMNAAEVGDVEPFRGVVLGGSIYIGRWHRDAVGFLKRNSQVLGDLPLAIFGMGPRSLADEELAQSRAQLDASLAKVRSVVPDTVAIFGGVLDPSKLRFPFNRMPASDARDWTAIRAWAAEIAQLFAAQTLPV